MMNKYLDESKLEIKGNKIETKHNDELTIDYKNMGPQQKQTLINNFSERVSNSIEEVKDPKLKEKKKSELQSLDTKDELEEIGFEIILANTYHLFLRPGADLIHEAGGLHGFSGWKRNFLTDSGGFQVFSLSKLRKISDEGVTFQSHIDGSRHFFTPENVVQTQVKFNSDIQMQLDVCSGYGVEKSEAERALKITSAWAKRAKDEWILKRGEGYEGILLKICAFKVRNSFLPSICRELQSAD